MVSLVAGVWIWKRKKMKIARGRCWGDLEGLVYCGRGSGSRRLQGEWVG
jgi:hypothetical protein